MAIIPYVCREMAVGASHDTDDCLSLLSREEERNCK